MQEAELRSPQIKFPHPAKTLVIKLGGLGPVGGEARPPIAKSVIVVQPQHFHIGGPQALAFQLCKSFRQGRYISARENIFAEEWPRGARLGHTPD